MRFLKFAGAIASNQADANRLKSQTKKKKIFARNLGIRIQIRLTCFCFILLTRIHSSSVGQGSARVNPWSCVRSLAVTLLFTSFAKTNFIYFLFFLIFFVQFNLSLN